MTTPANRYAAVAAALWTAPAAADRAALVRAHREHCWRARHGNAALHLAHAAAIRRRLARLGRG